MDQSTVKRNEGVRRSARENLGQHPKRLGFEDKNKHDANAPKASQAKPKPTASVKTTSSAAAQRKEIEAEKTRRLGKVRKEVKAKKVEVGNLEADLEAMEENYKLLEEGVGAESVEAAEQRHNDMKSLKSAMISLKNRIRRAKLDLEFAESTLADDEKIIEAECDAEKEAVSDCESVGNLSIPDEDAEQKKDRVGAWADEAKVHNVCPPPENHHVAQVPVITSNKSQVNVDEAKLHNVCTVAPPPPPQVFQTPIITMNRSQVNENGDIVQSQAVYPNPYQGRITSTPVITFQDAHAYRPDPLPQQSRSNEESLMERLVSAMERVGSGGRQEIFYKTPVDKKLPNFDGNPARWITFFSEYTRTTEKYKYDDSENMCRIHDALMGEALKTVSHLLGNPLNLRKVISVLQQRFGKPEFVLDYMVEEIKSVKQPDLSDPKSIVDFGIAIDALVTNVNSYGKLEYLSSTHLVTELVKKLPVMMRKQWYDWVVSNDHEQQLKHFAKWMELQSKSALLGIKPKVSIAKQTEEKKVRPKRGPGSVNTTATEKTEDRTKVKPHCALCKMTSHTLDKCWSFPKKNLTERWKIVKEASPQICICCLREGHRSKKCPKAKQCDKPGCKYYHHALLHSDEPYTNVTDMAQEERERQVNTGSINVTITNRDAVIKGCDGPLPIVPVMLQGPIGTKKAYALLDSGASRSLITQELATAVGLEGESCPYQFTSISGKKSVEPDSQLVHGQVAGVYRNAKYLPMRNAVTVRNIVMPPYSFNTKKVKNSFPHLRRVQAENLVNVVPEIIIGNNNPVLILAKEILSDGHDAPVGWRTPLGWTISGNFDDTNSQGSINFIGGQRITNEYLHDLIKSSFTTENFGVVPVIRSGKNIMEEKSYRIMKETTRKVGNRWETGLLWKDSAVYFPESEVMAYVRLRSAERKMRDLDFAALYKGKFAEYLEKGYLKKLTQKEANHRDARTWYIPHFGVTNVNKPGKLRFVLDAAAKSFGVCLNDALMKGPDLIRPLTTVLWNFRLHKIAITGDIADMFHRVLVRKEDRNSQRVLWRDGDTSKAPDHYEMQVLIFGATSSPSSAIYVKNENAKLFSETHHEAVRAIIEDHYVDDCLSGAKTEEEAITLRNDITMINAAGSFVERRWMSNSTTVIESIPEDYRADGAKNLDEKSQLPTERVLGMWWDPNKDVFTFRLGLHKVPKEILDGERPTKRQVCSLVMSLFDPLGFINHYKVKGIMILQRLWRSEVDWDEEIPTREFDIWCDWLQRIHGITEVKVPRWYSNLVYDADTVELHTFVDASEEAFAAVSYLRFVKGNEINVSLMGSKARVAALKKMTIPRLELQAALLGARLAQVIGQELRLKFSLRYFWSDSRTVLSWLKSEAGKFKEFVANRVGEIQEISDPMEWKWVPTDLNVADVATRYAGEISFSPEDRWFTGPEFLRHDVDSWPKEKKSDESIVATTVVERLDNKSIDDGGREQDVSLPTIENFSCYNRLLRAIAAVEKAARLFGKKPVMPLPERLEHAEKRLLRFVQDTSFPEEMKAPKYCNGEIRRQKITDGKIARLSPVLMDGLLRVKGRIERAQINHDAKFPIILPSRHRVTELIIMGEHKRCAHQGRETVLNNLRQKYWIVDGRQAVIRTFKQCGECRIRKAKPVIPVMGILPSYRLAACQPPFTFTGLDFFGPMEVTVGRHHEKRWGALFCCLVTRAVHLEVAHGLSTDEAMMCLSRFIDTRGRPRVIFSDNGTNFVGAAKEFERRTTSR